MIPLSRMGGICSSAASVEQVKSTRIDAALDGSHEKDKAKIKLLLLGRSK